MISRPSGTGKAFWLSFGLILTSISAQATHFALDWTASASSNISDYNLYYATFSFDVSGSWISTATARSTPNISINAIATGPTTSTTNFCLDNLSLTSEVTYYYRLTAVSAGQESGFNQNSGTDAQVSVFNDTGNYVNLSTGVDTARLVLSPGNTTQALLTLQMYDTGFPAGNFTATVGMPSGNKAGLSFTESTSSPTVYYTTVASTTFSPSDFFDLTGVSVSVTITAGGSGSFTALGQGGTFDQGLGGAIQESSGPALALIAPYENTGDGRLTISSEPADVGGIRAGALTAQALASAGSGRSFVLSSCGYLSTATITIPYTPSLIPSGLSTSQLSLAYYNPNTVSWVTQSSVTVNTVNNTVSAVVSNFAIDPTFSVYYAIYQPVVQIDTIAPTVAITAPKAASDIGGIYTVTGTAHDNVLVSSVAVSVDGGAYTLATGTAAWTFSLNTNLLTNASHTLMAKAWDEMNNVSTFTVTVTVDNVPPTVAITYPANNAFVSGGIIVQGTAHDNVLVSSVAVSVDGGAYTKATSTAAWTFVLNTNTLANSTHSLTAEAWDEVGNTITSSITITVENVPPTVVISTPQNGAVVARTVTISGTSADPVTISSVGVSVDGGAYALATGTGSWSYNLNTLTLTSANHFVTAKAWDILGGSSTFIVSILVDNIPPTVAITSPTAGATIAGVFTVDGTAADNVALSSVALSIDGGAYNPVTGSSPWTFTLNTNALANSTHSLTAQAWDSSNNTSTTSITITVYNPSTYTYVQLAWSPTNLAQANVAIQSTDPTFPTSASFNAVIGFPSGAQTIAMAQLTSTPLQYSAVVSSSNFQTTDFFYGSSTFSTTIGIGAQNYNATFLPRDINPALGGAILEPSGPSQVIVMPGQISQDAQVTISPEPAGSQSTYLAGDGLSALGAGRDISFVSAGTLTAATLTLPFDPTLVPSGFNTSDARIAYFNSVNNSWQVVGNISLNAINDTLSASVTRFGIDAPVILMPATAPGLNASIVYPDPAVPPYDPTIRICPGIVDSIDATIFDVSGRVVNSSTQFTGPFIPTQGVGSGQYCYEYTWGGHKSSGVYFAVVHAKGSGTTVKARMKFVVIR